MWGEKKEAKHTVGSTKLFHCLNFHGNSAKIGEDERDIRDVTLTLIYVAVTWLNLSVTFKGYRAVNLFITLLLNVL